MDIAAPLQPTSSNYPLPSIPCTESTALPAVATTTSRKLKLQNSGTLCREDFDGGPVSLDEIERGLFLGNLTAATNMETLKTYKITHILTLDSVPLPSHIVEASFLTTKYVHISDMPKEDIIHHLDQSTEFIKCALEKGGNVLVHCYFGVSRSSAAVIAFVMKQHKLDYQQAFDLVKSKRRFVQPNAGFISQLKLYWQMGCCIEPQYQKYKIYRLRLAGEQVRKVKILPQTFNNLIKPDPAVTQENPEPIVYRCRKCRRVLASRSHVLLHASKLEKSKVKQQKAAAEPLPDTTRTPPRLIDQIAEQIRRTSLDAVGSSSTCNGTINTTEELAVEAKCRSILFVEPIAWMKNILNSTQGRLNCPKCDQKLGSFSWVNGCQCPCGEEITPAFYMIPSKVELSTAVQNVQTTV